MVLTFGGLGQLEGAEVTLGDRPGGEKAIEECMKAIVMQPFEQVGHCMNDDVFQTMGRRFNQVEIQPDPASLNVAGSPLCFHPFYAPLVDSNQPSRQIIRAIL